MRRQDFLKRLVMSAAGLFVADDAIELLTHRKVWAGHSFAPPGTLTDLAVEYAKPVTLDLSASDEHALIRSQEVLEIMWKAMRTQIRADQKASQFFRTLAANHKTGFVGRPLKVSLRA